MNLVPRRDSQPRTLMTHPLPFGQPVPLPGFAPRVTFSTTLLGTERVPGMYRLTKAFLTRVSSMIIGIDLEPVMPLTALPKPSNRTRFHRRYARNPLGILINDTAVEFTDKICVALANALERIKKGVKLQKATRELHTWTWQGHFYLQLILRISSGLIPLPHKCESVHRSKDRNQV